MDTNLSTLWEAVKDREACCAAVHEVTKSRTWLSDWKTATKHKFTGSSFYRYKFTSSSLMAYTAINI